MQVLMLIKVASSDYEAGRSMPQELDSAMGELIGEWSKSGHFISAAGLKPTSQGARVRLTAERALVTDGPFTEAKEVVGGFFMLEVPSLQTAVEMTRQFVELHRRILGPDFHLECELRPLDG
jgi:hypothetical protein